MININKTLYLIVILTTFLCANHSSASEQTNCKLLFENNQFTDAYPYCVNEARNGNALSQTYLGRIYHTGEGTKRNYTNAVKWYTLAANQGEPAAQLNLGIIYLFGANGNIKTDYSIALKWLKPLAEQGQPLAAYFLSKLFLLTKPVDTKKSSEWLAFAASSGMKEAEYDLFQLATAGNPFTDTWNKMHPEKFIVGTAALDTKKFIYFDISQVKKTSRGLAAFLFLQTRENPTKKSVMTVLINCAEFSTYVTKYDFYENNEVETVRFNEEVYDVATPMSPFGRLISISCGTINKADNTKKPKSFGTGWVVSNNYVVTNYHVVKGHNKFTLMSSNGNETSAKLVTFDAANDLAILKFKGSSKAFLPIAKKPLRIGDKVFTIGFPHPNTMGTQPKLTNGTISSISGINDDPRIYQISVPLQAGNSGGPLLNMRGEVVGIVTSKLSAIKVFNWTGDLPQNVNYAIKSPYLSAMLSTIKIDNHSSVLQTKKKQSLSELAEEIKKLVTIIVAE